ncbi:MAG: ECF-type sigma factor [Phycisphaerae bacterium]
MGSTDLTQLLLRAGADLPHDKERLVEVVYKELRAMAEHRMKPERAGHTLQPTALVNEAYLRLVGNLGDLHSRVLFFGAAAQAMERVLVDHARTKQALKRGGNVRRVTFSDLDVASPDDRLCVLDVHDALVALEREQPDLAAMVRFRYFLGLTLEQIAEMSGVSLATCKRRWTYSKAWLFDRLANHDGDPRNADS